MIENWKLKIENERFTIFNSVVFTETKLRILGVRFTRGMKKISSEDELACIGLNWHGVTVMMISMDVFIIVADLGEV